LRDRFENKNIVENKKLEEKMVEDKFKKKIYGMKKFPHKII
jgi:hypothetical protein